MKLYLWTQRKYNRKFKNLFNYVLFQSMYLEGKLKTENLTLQWWAGRAGTHTSLKCFYKKVQNSLKYTEELEIKNWESYLLLPHEEFSCAFHSQNHNSWVYFLNNYKLFPMHTVVKPNICLIYPLLIHSAIPMWYSLSLKQLPLSLLPASLYDFSLLTMRAKSPLWFKPPTEYIFKSNAWICFQNTLHVAA